MKEKYKVVGLKDGVGGLCLTFQCAYFIQEQGHDVEILIAARDEVFMPLYHLFNKYFQITRIKEFWNEEFDHIVKNEPESIEVLKGDAKDIYFVWPDALFRNPYAFDYAKFKVAPHVIKQQRLLLKERAPQNIIYCALNTTTPEYKYPYVQELLEEIALQNPKYSVVFNDITKWAGIDIDNKVTDKGIENLIILKDASFISQIDLLKQSDYCVCLDNGFSHLSYQMGIERLLISKRLNYDSKAWRARWYESLNDCISYNYPPKMVANLIKLNLEIPETCMITKDEIIRNFDLSLERWSQKLIFKY